jgi:hypothetical protein
VGYGTKVGNINHSWQTARKAAALGAEVTLHASYGTPDGLRSPLARVPAGLHSIRYRCVRAGQLSEWWAVTGSNR